MEVKYKRNRTFLDARKMVESYMKDNTYANVAQKVSSINQINTELSLKN